MTFRTKDSGIEWVGHIPSHWSTRRIKFLANREENSFIDGDWIESPYVIDKGIPYFTTGNIGDGVFKPSDSASFISKESFEELKCKFAYGGDLIFSRLNAPYGRSCLLPLSVGKCVIAVDNVILRTDQCKEFVCYVTQCPGYQKMIEGLSAGTAMKRISRTRLGNVKIPLPPLAEQRSIATFLNKKCCAIDSLIASKQAILERLEEYRKAVINNAVTEEQWSGSRGQWQKYPFSQLFILGRGLGITKADLVQTGVACLSYGQIHSYCNGFYDDSKHKLPFVSEEYLSSAPKSLLHKGDFVFADTSEDLKGAGNCSCVIGDGPVFAGYHTIIARPVRNVSSRYLGYYFQSDDFRKQIREEVNGIKVYSITNTILKRTRIALPPIVVQEQIATELDKKCSTIAALVNQEQTAIETLKEYRQSLITAAVTGQLDLDNN